MIEEAASFKTEILSATSERRLIKESAILGFSGLHSSLRMNFVKNAIWGPDPKEQHRRLKSILRKNDRQLAKSLSELSSLKSKTQQLIKNAAKQNDIKTVRLYAKELYHVNKQYNRMYTSKAVSYTHLDVYKRQE